MNKLSQHDIERLERIVRKLANANPVDRHGDCHVCRDPGIIEPHAWDCAWVEACQWMWTVQARQGN